MCICCILRLYKSYRRLYIYIYIYIHSASCLPGPTSHLHLCHSLPLFLSPLCVRTLPLSSHIISPSTGVIDGVFKRRRFACLHPESVGCQASSAEQKSETKNGFSQAPDVHKESVSP